MKRQGEAHLQKRRTNKALPMYFDNGEERVMIKAIVNKVRGWYYAELVDGRTIPIRLKHIMKGNKRYG